MTIDAVPRDMLSTYLEDALLTGKISPGSRLPSERLLAQRFGLSRPSVREVIKELQERGLVRVIPGRGTFVREPSSVDSIRPLEAYYRRRNATPREVTDARIMLETHAAVLAARNATEDDLTALRKMLSAFEMAGNVVEKARADIAFHILIARAARNSVLEVMFLSIAGLTFEYMLRSLADPTIVREGAPYHDDILAAIADRDTERARRAMEGHLSVAHYHYGEDLDQGLDTLARRELTRLMGPGVSLDGIIESVLSALDGPGDDLLRLEPNSRQR
ncbi:FadR/GntR family transcriptional regulator [Nonomuraea sp. H19]|uniref:FadR/GntR family transcriptional regulator n=1 Tax=Nonomuraea sp. H19 TaxID=3452206 RepID=UPI003F8C0408